MSKRVAVLTTGRQDFGILRSTVRALDDDPRFELLLWVGGMHLLERFGATVELVRAEGVPIARRLPFLSDPPDADRDTAAAFEGVAEALRADRPDALLLVGDRTETLSAAFAAVTRQVPIVHLHGGEESEGAIDNALRHAITKLANLHLTTHESHARRVLQMGEDPATVHVIPPPGIDNLYRNDLPDRAGLLAELGLADPSPAPLVVVTVHPTTLSTGSPLAEAEAVAAALDGLEAGIILTMPNSDDGGTGIRDFWIGWAEGREEAVAVSALGEQRYWGLLRSADLMIANSSSGLVEAPAAHLPVVNVGDRQRGRLRHPLTLDTPPEAAAILAAAREVGTPEYRARLRAAEPLYPRGPAWPRILKILGGWEPSRPPRKVFRDRPVAAEAS